MLPQPRFIAGIALGDSTFSLDSLMAVCRVLSCGSDCLLPKLRQLDLKYQEPLHRFMKN